jgi:4-amino-4-deoxy-L-arabinose transferase-like glycosyltransferase
VRWIKLWRFIVSELTITQSEKGFFSRRAGLFTALGLGLIILLGAFLRMYQLGAFSVGNSYYAATVQSMLTSWHNFFYASFEPGGSVSVDKPPLGFWVEAVSAYILGVNGFALALPNALAGILSIPLLFHLVKKQFGTWPGLIAALTLAVVPVSVSTERNNTIDGMLVFVLLLAVWAVWKSVESSKFRYLLLGAFLVGLGFNIKMLQAYMVLPALYALYFFGAKHGWWKRLAHLGIATVLLLVVSLSWVVIVDLTPSDSRPYVGSSTDNTELELIVGHNGLSRLVAGGMRSLNGNNAAPRLDGGQPVAAGSEGGQIRPPSPSDGQRLASQGGAAGQFPPRSADGQSSQTPPLDGRAAPSVGGQFAGPGGAGGPGGSRTSEVGSAGLLRLFSEPLVTEASWILPLALMGMLLVLIVLGWEWPLSEKHLAIVLWAGWLLPVTLYFTFTTGLFHAYYLIMLGPPLAALTGATVWALGRVVRKRHWSGWILAALLTGLTLAFELITLLNYPQYLAMVTIFSGTFWLIGISLLAVRSQG